MAEKFTRWLIDLIFHLTIRLKVIGREYVPVQGSFVVTANHIGRLDAILIFSFTQRRDIIMLVAEKYANVPFISWLGKQIGLIWVDRFNADFSAVREALSRLKKGGMLVLAPEGTRSHTGELQEGRSGASFLAAKAGVPIVPVALVDSDDAVVKRNLLRFRRTLVTVRVGKPFRLPPIHGGDRDAILQSYTDEIMCRIAALLPSERRGVYADHPRLMEILEEPA